MNHPAASGGEFDPEQLMLNQRFPSISLIAASNAASGGAPTITRPSTDPPTALPSTNVGVPLMPSEAAYLASSPISFRCLPSAMQLLKASPLSERSFA